jgi:hypothetical protein
MANDNSPNKETASVSTPAKKAKKELDRQFLQIPIENWAFAAWKELADKEGLDRKQCLEQLIEEFIKTKSAYKYEQDGRQKHIVLKVAALGAKSRSIWINSKSYIAAETFAQVIPARTNRVVYTALIEGLVNRGIIDI